MTQVVSTDIGNIRDGSARFFAYARLRHLVHLRRLYGHPRPWTTDPILQEYRFTNVFREYDKTTLWFNKNVRGPLRDKPEVMLATVLFRMLNRIEIGEALFRQTTMGERDVGQTAFEEYCEYGKWQVLRAAIKAAVPRGPYVTGAYIISTPPGKNKLDGALWTVDNFARTSGWREMAELWLMRGAEHPSLEHAFRWFSSFPYLGKFHSYEIVTDLRHTLLLNRAPDIVSWANIGPGCRRGMNRIKARSRTGDVSGRRRWGTKISDKDMLDEMKILLAMSRDPLYWPQQSGTMVRGLPKGSPAPTRGDWPKWEMREVEHTLCEFDKYERVRNGEGRPRGRFA